MFLYLKDFSVTIYELKTNLDQPCHTNQDNFFPFGSFPRAVAEPLYICERLYVSLNLLEDSYGDWHQTKEFNIKTWSLAWGSEM